VRASIYCRISKDRVGAGLGVATQEADCRELASKLGWDVVTVHTDNDISAHSGRRRPGYEALLDQIRAGDINAVIAWHTDRLHRSPVELEAYVTACE
jgi:site-specific DNA recombinase